MLIYLLWVWISYLHVCLCKTCMFGACGQKKTSSILEPNKQMVLSCITQVLRIEHGSLARTESAQDH